MTYNVFSATLNPAQVNDIHLTLSYHFHYQTLRRLSQAEPPLQQGNRPPPQFSAHICCGQMAGWIKMPLGMQEGLGQGNFVLDRDPAPELPSRKRGRSPLPNFRSMSIEAIRLDGSRWHLAQRWVLVQATLC